jgi:hypothetical protein
MHHDPRIALYEDTTEIIFHEYLQIFMFGYIGSSVKFILKEGVEESIVNAPRIRDHGSAV